MLKRWGNNNLDRTALAQLVALVEGLPLALTLLGGQLQNGYAPAELITALTGDGGAPNILDLGPPRTRTRNLIECFEFSYNNLSEKALKQRFAQLGCFAGLFVDKMAAAIWGLERAEARRTLGQLTRFMMIQEEDRWYRLHSLLRDYAEQRLLETRPELVQATYQRHAAYFLRHYLYQPQILEGSVDHIPNLDLRWADIVAGVKWATRHSPRIAAQAVLLAHTERPALLEAVGPSLIEAVGLYIKEVTDRAEQALLSEVLGDLALLQEDVEAGIGYFRQTGTVWQSLENGLAGSQAMLRVAGAHLVGQDRENAAEAARQAQALLEQSLPLTDDDGPGVRQLFYWFNMVYNPLVRWQGLPEEDIAGLVQLSEQTGNLMLKARALSIHQLWCTTRPHSEELRRRGGELALKAYALWRKCGRLDRADDEISFSRYRLKNYYSRRVAARFARRRSRTTPRVGPSQVQLMKGRDEALYWWLGAEEKQRVGWLSWMMPRYLEADNRPRQPATGIRLSKLRPESRAYRWVEVILNVGMLGGAGRRIMMEKQPPDNHFLNGPEWRMLSGQRVLPLASPEAGAVVKRYLATLEAILE